MKTIFKNAFLFVMLSIVTLAVGKVNAGPNPPDQMLFSVAIPASLQSSIVREDFENQTIFSLKNGNDKPVFLFSVSKVTGDQWLMLHDQVKNSTVIENQNGYIVFVEKTNQPNIKGDAAAQYQQILLQLNTIIQSIHTNS